MQTLGQRTKWIQLNTMLVMCAMNPPNRKDSATENIKERELKTQEKLGPKPL